MKFIYSDAGRSNYFKGDADDCVIRAIVHATKKDYKEVYNHFKKMMPKGKSPRMEFTRSSITSIFWRMVLNGYLL